MRFRPVAYSESECARASVPRDSAALGTTTVEIYRRKLNPPSTRTKHNSPYTPRVLVPDYILAPHA